MNGSLRWTHKSQWAALLTVILLIAGALVGGSLVINRRGGQGARLQISGTEHPDETSPAEPERHNQACRTAQKELD